jgi:hypothetical protein
VHFNLIGIILYVFSAWLRTVSSSRSDSRAKTLKTRLSDLLEETVLNQAEKTYKIMPIKLKCTQDK